MRALLGGVLLLSVGCSTAPIADLLDYTSPGRSTPDPYQRGTNGPRPPAIPPVPFDRPPSPDADRPPIKLKDREPPKAAIREDDPPPIAPPPSGD